jgi:hypothetical protein
MTISLLCGWWVSKQHGHYVAKDGVILNTTTGKIYLKQDRLIRKP